VRTEKQAERTAARQATRIARSGEDEPQQECCSRKKIERRGARVFLLHYRNSRIAERIERAHHPHR